MPSYEILFTAVLLDYTEPVIVAPTCVL